MAVVEQDVAELEEATFSVLEEINLKFSPFCSFYKQLKLKPVDTKESYEKYKEDDFFDLAYSYPRVDDEDFDLSKLEHAVFTRFVELLASLTLYHVSKTSKGIYYHCLNIRGLEYKSINVCSPSYPSRIREFDVKGPYFEGFEGMRCAYVGPDKFAKFRICHNHLNLCTNCIDNDDSLLFVKKYRSLHIEISCDHPEEKVNQICGSVLHPGVLYANILYKKYDPRRPYQELSLDHFGKILGHCKHVRVLHISVGISYLLSQEITSDLARITFKKDPHFSIIKRMIESWALQTTQLELFLFYYKKHQFQLRNNVLKRVVFSKNKWYFTDDCNIDDNPKTFWQSRYYQSPVSFFHRSHFDYIIAKTPLPLNERTKRF